MGLNIILFIAGWSITSLIVNGSIFDKIKIYIQVKSEFIGKLVNCMQCSGFWIGIILFYPIFYFKIINPIFSLPLLNYLIYPFLQSGIGVLIESFIIFMVKTKNN